MVFLDMRFEEDELARLYADYRGDAYNALREVYEPGYQHLNAWRIHEGFQHQDAVEQFILESIPAPRAVLDIGGDSGINTPFRGSLEVHAVLDVSGVATVEGAVTVSEVAARIQDYDLVVLSHVLEHVAYPHETLNLPAPS